jgi:hypothetical protein
MKSITLFFIFFGLSVYGQSLHHQMLSAQGTSTILSNGVFVSQTIGQQSVIGNYTKNGVTYGQGFQQSVWSKYIKSSAANTITTVTYPNPFISAINFQFSQPIKETISVALFDIRGRLVYTEDKKAADIILTLELPNLASSNYLVRLSSPNYTYYTQILKQ